MRRVAGLGVSTGVDLDNKRVKSVMTKRKDLEEDAIVMGDKRAVYGA